MKGFSVRFASGMEIMQCFVSLTAGGLNPWLTVCSYANRDNDILILTFNHYEVNLRSSGVNFGHNYCMNAFISWHWLVISKPTPRYHLNALHTFVEAFRSDLRLASDQPLRARGSKSGHGQRVECLSSGLSGAVEGKIFFGIFWTVSPKFWNNLWHVLQALIKMRCKD